MPRKILDISLIKEDKSDLTFFNIDEEETNETLKALKQSYVTTNYKEETILNLQSELNSNSDTTSKELKLESYRKYNNALDLAYKNYITSAVDMIESALELNPKDVDLLNLKGLLKLLKCDFSKAFESFYTGLCYGNNELSRKYVDILSEEDFKVFLARYNHSIRFINEELNQESIHILNNIIGEDPDLTEPYVILSLLYDKLGDIKKKESYLEKLKEVDRDNPLFEDNYKKETEQNQTQKKEEYKKPNKSKKTNKKNLMPYLIIGIFAIGMIGYIITNKNKIDNLNKELSSKSQELDEKSKILDETNKQLDEEKNREVESQIIVADEETLYTEAIKFKNDKEYDKAIERFKLVVSSGKTKKYISESIHELGIVNERIGDIVEAIKYYNKYVNTYPSDEKYYDDSLYKMGMLYYDNGDLENAKKMFYNLRSQVPDSMYNNSKVKAILSE